MSLKTDLTGLGQRLAGLEERFGSRRRAKSVPPGQTTGIPKSFYSSLRDLFTQGVTNQALKELVKRDLLETLDFFTRTIDFASLRSRPWYKRYPGIGWETFLSLAYRLSPARRVAFAVAALSFLVGSLRLLGSSQTSYHSGTRWWLVALMMVTALLFLELRDKLDLKHDLEIARDIQFGLVPPTPFQQDEITIHCHMRPANTVGGDYYDIIDIGNRNIAVVLADVAGKGMPAALLMALLQGSLRTLITAGLRGSELIRQLNTYLYINIPDGSLVTLFHGELNTTTGELHYVNAGHNAPFLVHRDQTQERLESTSVALGVLRDPTFQEQCHQIGRGDHLLLFTDGIPEAFNTEDREYGEVRLSEFLKIQTKLPQNEMLQALIRDVLSFCGEARPADDMTIMSIKRVV